LEEKQMSKSLEEKQLVEAIKGVQKSLGWKAWRLLGKELRQALVREEVLRIIAIGAQFEDSAQGRLATLAMAFEGDEE
jgi:hypothetical protein